MMSKLFPGLPIFFLVSLLQTSAAQTPGALSTIPQGSQSVKAVPDKPTFEVGGRSVVLHLYADKTATVTAIRQVSLVDDVTGRPARKAIDDKDKFEEEILAAQVEPFELTLAKSWKQAGHSYSGVLAVTYRVDKVNAVALVNFNLLDKGVRSTDKPREAELKARDPDARLAIAPGPTVLKFCVVAQKGDVLVDHVATEIIDDGLKKPMDTKTVGWAGPKRIGPDSTNPCFEGSIPEDVLRDVYSASGKVSVSYRAAGGGNASTASWNFQLFRPVLEVRALDSRLQLERRIPFRPDHACFDLRYRTFPAGRVLSQDMLSLDVEAVGPNGNFRPPNVKLSQRVPEGQADQDRQKLHLCVDIPNDVTTLQSHIWIQPPVTAMEIELKPLLTVKDKPIWRGAATALAYLLALSVLWGTGEIRRRIFNDVRRKDLFARLGMFLAGHRGLSNHQSVELVRQALSNSKLQDVAGSSDLAERSLASAETRLDQLTANPPSPTEETASSEVIRVLEPQSQRVTGRELSLQILSLPEGWKESDTFAWSLTDPGNKSTAVASGPGLTRISHVFETEGEYTVQVTTNNRAQQRKIVIDRPKALSRSQRLGRLLGFLNVVPTVVGAILAAAAAYLTTANAASWGTAGDYLTLFLTAFGLSAGTQALGPILTSIRRG
jgi:hypothetical protein